MSESAPGGFSQMEAVAQQLQANAPTAEELNARTAKNLAIEARSVTPEVSAMNDAAEIAIFGTRGHTAGYTDKAGNPLTAPIPGRINDILNAPIPKWGKDDAERAANPGAVKAHNTSKTAERQAKAEKYQADIEGLLGEGFQLGQAKLIMDDREKVTANNNLWQKHHDSTVAKRVEMIKKQNIKNGDDPVLAEAKAVERVGKQKDLKTFTVKVTAGGKKVGERPISKIDADDRDSMVKAYIRNNGIFGEGDLAPKPTTPAVDPAEKAKANDKLKDLTSEVNDERNEYARLSAGRGRRFGFGNKRYSEKAVQQARAKWESSKSRKDLIAHERDMALAAGVSLEDLDNYAGYFAIGDAENMARRLGKERLLATGSFQQNASGAISEIRPKTPLGRMANGFYKWWGKQNNEKFLSTATLKKGAAMGGLGVAVGVPAALAGTFLLGPIAGGALGAVAATKIAKGVMANHVAKKSKGQRYVDELHGQLRQNIYNGHAGDIGDFIDNQTKGEVKSNRRRVIAGLAAAAVGGALGEIGANHLLGFGDAHNSAHGAGSHGAGHHDAHPKTAHHHRQTHHKPSHHRGATGEKDVTLKLTSEGDNPWNEISHYMNSHGYDGNNNAEVFKVDSSVVANPENHLTWSGAHQLHEGYTFKIPHEVIDSLEKKSKS